MEALLQDPDLGCPEEEWARLGRALSGEQSCLHVHWGVESRGASEKGCEYRGALPRVISGKET